MRTDPTIAYGFDEFRLFPLERLLMDGDVACALGSRAVEILLCLVERAGETVTKQELLTRAWPDTFVHEANLRVSISGLRKALRDGQGGRRYLVNLTGQGYSFVAPVRRIEAERPLAGPSVNPASRHNLPARSSRILGRDPDIQAIALQLPMRRCVTMTGPGGIGKTTAAIAAAERVLPVYDDGVWFVDLSAITEAQPIALTVAHVLGVSVHAGGAMTGLNAYLRDKRLLLILDNCEHVIDGAAALAESILLNTAHVSILCTSREALRVSHEWVHRLGPLAAPGRSGDLTAVEALAYDAVKFFVECAARNVEDFTLADEDVASVIEICIGLDGLPLAIELAAARIDIFGVRGLAAVLDDSFLLSAEGRRTALPRQQSLLRTLEWSYRLLSSGEQAILRRLSVFRGRFTLAGALAIAAGDGVEAEEVYSGVLTLSAKSLITSDISAETPQHHHSLLHVTRSLLLQKLGDTPEAPETFKRHAYYIRELLAKAEIDWEVMQRNAWLEVYGRSIEDVRAAIDWAFSAEGEISLGIVLTAMALPLGFQLSLIDEFRVRVERALLHSRQNRLEEQLWEMRLNIALCLLGQNIKGPAQGRTAAMERATQISKVLDKKAYQAEPLLAWALGLNSLGEYANAADAADQARRIGEEANDPMAVLAAERILAQAHHFNGDQDLAETLAQRVVENPALRIPLAYNPMPVDRRVAMQIILARIAWLRGELRRADDIIEVTLATAETDGAFSLCPVLAFGAIPIALWNGDDHAAGLAVDALAEQASRYKLGYWKRWAESFSAVTQVRGGDISDIPEFSGPLELETFATFSHHFLTPEAAMRADRGSSGWCSAEIRRVQGEWLLTDGTREDAEALFQRALEIARTQRALSWELRAAISLARLWKDSGRVRMAADLLDDVLGRYKPGFANADQRQAVSLLRGLRNEKNATIPARRPAASPGRARIAATARGRSA